MICRLELRDALAKLKSINPIDVWPRHKEDSGLELRICFHKDPLQTFLNCDDDTQDRIVAIMNGTSV